MTTFLFADGGRKGRVSVREAKGEKEERRGEKGKGYAAPNVESWIRQCIRVS